MKTDQLTEIFYLRESFMKELQASSSSEAGFKWPLDLSEKKNQQFLKSLAHECMRHGASRC